MRWHIISFIFILNRIIRAKFPFLLYWIQFLPIGRGKLYFIIFFHHFPWIPFLILFGFILLMRILSFPICHIILLIKKYIIRIIFLMFIDKLFRKICRFSIVLIFTFFIISIKDLIRFSIYFIDRLFLL